MRIDSAAASVLLVLTLSLYTASVSAEPLYSFCWVFTDGVNLVDDPVNGVLSFQVSETGNGTYLLYQRIEYGVEQYQKFLLQGDSVVINYRDCNVTYKSIVEYIPGNYLIGYTGEANSVTINALQVPEFPSFLIPPLFIISALLIALISRRKKVRITSPKQ